VKISRAALYRYEAEFKKGGIEALVPRYLGGGRRRIPPEDAALLRDLSRQTTLYGFYAAARRHARLTGRPITRSSAREVTGDFVESERAIRRLRHVKRGGRD